jgi:hypothetical protein
MNNREIRGVLQMLAQYSPLPEVERVLVEAINKLEELDIDGYTVDIQEDIAPFITAGGTLRKVGAIIHLREKFDIGIAKAKLLTELAWEKYEQEQAHVRGLPEL